MISTVESLSMVAIMSSGKTVWQSAPSPHRIFDKFPPIACLCVRPRDGAARCPWKRTRRDGRRTLVSWCVIVNPKRPPIITTLLRVISIAFDDSARAETTATDEGARFADRVLSQYSFSALETARCLFFAVISYIGSIIIYFVISLSTIHYSYTYRW